MPMTPALRRVLLLLSAAPLAATAGCSGDESTPTPADPVAAAATEAATVADPAAATDPAAAGGYAAGEEPEPTPPPKPQQVGETDVPYGPEQGLVDMTMDHPPLPEDWQATHRFELLEVINQPELGDQAFTFEVAAGDKAPVYQVDGSAMLKDGRFVGQYHLSYGGQPVGFERVTCTWTEADAKVELGCVGGEDVTVKLGYTLVKDGPRMTLERIDKVAAKVDHAPLRMVLVASDAAVPPQ